MASKKSFKTVNPAMAYISAQEGQEGARDADVESSSTRPAAVPDAAPEPPEGYKVNPMYIEKRSQRAQFLLQPSTVTALKEIARGRGVSVNEIVNEALKAYIKDHRGE